MSLIFSNFRYLFDNCLESDEGEHFPSGGEIKVSSKGVFKYLYTDVSSLFGNIS